MDTKRTPNPQKTNTSSCGRTSTDLKRMGRHSTQTQQGTGPQDRPTPMNTGTNPKPQPENMIPGKGTTDTKRTQKSQKTNTSSYGRTSTECKKDGETLNLKLKEMKEREKMKGHGQENPTPPLE